MRQKPDRNFSRAPGIDDARGQSAPPSAWLTGCCPCVRYARMSRSVVFAGVHDARAPRIFRRVGVAIALAATLGQLLVAAHPEIAHAIATHATSALATAVATIGADAAHANPHDSAECPMCRALAHARTALRSVSVPRATAPFPRLELVWLDFEDLPGQLARSTVTPRAPPA